MDKLVCSNISQWTQANLTENRKVNFLYVNVHSFISSRNVFIFGSYQMINILCIVSGFLDALQFEIAEKMAFRPHVHLLAKNIQSMQIHSVYSFTKNLEMQFYALLKNCIYSWSWIFLRPERKYWSDDFWRYYKTFHGNQ